MGELNRCSAECGLDFNITENLKLRKLTMERRLTMVREVCRQVTTGSYLVHAITEDDRRETSFKIMLGMAKVVYNNSQRILTSSEIN